MRWSVGTFGFRASIRALEPREKLAVLVCTDLSGVFAASFSAYFRVGNAVGTGDLRLFVSNAPAPILRHFSIAACLTLRQKEFTHHEFS